MRSCRAASSSCRRRSCSCRSRSCRSFSWGVGSAGAGCCSNGGISKRDNCPESFFVLLVFLFLTCERSSCVKPKRSYRDMTGSGVVFAAVGRASVEGCSGVEVRRSTCIVCRSVEVECPFMLPDRLISRTCAMRCYMVSAGRLTRLRNSCTGEWRRYKSRSSCSERLRSRKYFMSAAMASIPPSCR